MRRTIVFGIMFFFLSFLSINSFAETASDEPVKKNSSEVILDPETTQENDFAKPIFKIIEAAQTSLDEEYDQIESEMADVVKNASKKLLASPLIFKALIKSAKLRYEADLAETEDEHSVKENREFYARMAMAGFQTQLRHITGSMTSGEMIARARIIADVAKYYDRKDPSMCRYLPQDFSLLMNVDAPWVGEVDQERLENALEAETKAIKRVYMGSDSIIISDADTQAIFSKFAAEWFSTLSDVDKNRIAVNRNSGNYCLLWATMLNDAAKMSEVYPKASKKILLPLMTMPTRGWLDVDKW